MVMGKSFPVSRVSSLRRLSIGLCEGLDELPADLWRLPALTKLELNKLLSLESLPDDIPDDCLVEEIELVECNMLDLPGSFTRYELLVRYASVFHAASLHPPCKALLTSNMRNSLVECRILLRQQAAHTFLVLRGSRSKRLMFP
jgi:hypothetical protein